MAYCYNAVHLNCHEWSNTFRRTQVESFHYRETLIASSRGRPICSRYFWKVEFVDVAIAMS